MTSLEMLKVLQELNQKYKDELDVEISHGLINFIIVFFLREKKNCLFT